MTETRAVSIEDVRTLVAERQRYDDWLAALEAKRAETPTRVFDRVHGDYQGRRDSVLQQLQSHESTLAALGDDLDERLRAIEEQLASLEDERAEAMLRTAVGEFDGDRWETVRREVEAGIETHGATRAALLVEVDDVRGLLASTRHTPADATAATYADDDPSAYDILPEATTSADTATSSSATTDDIADLSATLELEAEIEASAEAALGGFDAGVDSSNMDAALDIEDALALFSPASTEMTEVAPAAPPAPSSPVATADAFDDLAFLHSVIDPSGANGTASVLDRALPTVASGAATSNDQKTLRCTECGTMNLPTEWYCERCGGELAAF